MIVKLKGDGPILVVDDEPGFYDLVVEVHKRSKISNELRFFLSGQQCLDYLDDVKLGKVPLPSIVLMDINMPEMDGIETVKMIRSDPQFRVLPTISMLTTSVHQLDMSRSQFAGANDYVVKPITLDEHVDLFNSLVPYSQVH